ncbi:MAG: hypothetical protein KKA64_03635 [Nanoarchaeota archaeon]|nr:hypothetical protein [Nanoarchaeota archaeon]
MRIENIIFWILITAIIAVAIWMLAGSPPTENGLLMITLFVATSELLLWKTLFQIDKKTAIGFEKIRNNISNKFLGVDNKLNEIKSLIRK